MSKRQEEPEREQRILFEAVVDAYGPEEQAMGWYYYLEDRFHFPFAGKCTTVRTTSPLKLGEMVNVLAMAPEEACEHEMFVSVNWQKKRLAVPLSQITPVNADEETTEAVEDWHYWTERGYEL